MAASMAAAESSGSSPCTFTITSAAGSRASASTIRAVPLGAYAVDVAVLADGALVARSTTPFLVVKSGAEDEIAAAARNQPLLYGLAVAALALLSGWIASLIFRRD